MGKAKAVVCFLACQVASSAHAEHRTKTVPAERTTQIVVHTAWDPYYCGSVHGVVKVLTKPQHGRLSNRLIPTTIGLSRFGSSGQCYGKPTTGFAIYYTPVRGFRGTDSFSFDIRWPVISRQATDTYTVNVQ